MHVKQIEIGGRILSLRTGSVARQANGACWIQYGDTVVLTAATMSKTPREGIDFMPLMVDYRERTYAAGKFPGGFFKREGAPQAQEIITCRLIDRPIRPLFNKKMRHEIQINSLTLSADQVNDPDVLAIIGASAALTISDIPFDGPIGAVRVGKIGSSFIINPTYEQMEESTLDLVIAGTEENILMVEAACQELTEKEILESIEAAKGPIAELVVIQKELAAQIGLPKKDFSFEEEDQELKIRVKEIAGSRIAEINRQGLKKKDERSCRMEEIEEMAIEELGQDYPEKEAKIKQSLEETEREIVRSCILEKGKRADGRGLDEIRSIKCEVGILPRTHGSALFTRGQTQALAITTLGTVEDQQTLDNIEGRTTKAFILHYNFPSFSVGETKPSRGPSRRDIGHGMLAERALGPVLPRAEDFPYTIRVVSEILESNGSSSMASVCGGTLSLMDAGVPIKAPVAGIAMGLVKEDQRIAILTDIAGLEDYLGDMDLKVAGTTNGITALQMDIKVPGITFDILEEALASAKTARLFILEQMQKVIASPRPKISSYAPMIITLTIPQEKIGGVIGPGGKIIRKIIEDTGARINIDDDGTVTIAGTDSEGVQQAQEMVKYLTADAEIGKVYKGKVVRIVNFGAFVEILPGKDGLVHISELADYRVRQVEDVVREGDEIEVLVIGIDQEGRINLSKRQVGKAQSAEQGAGRRERR